METVTNDLAVVTIEISAPEMIVKTRDVGLSFGDKLGVVGKKDYSGVRLIGSPRDRLF